MHGHGGAGTCAGEFHVGRGGGEDCSSRQLLTINYLQPTQNVCTLRSVLGVDNGYFTANDVASVRIRLSSKDLMV